MQNGKFSVLHHTTIQDWIIDFRQLPIFDNVPESRPHLDIHHTTVAEWCGGFCTNVQNPPASRQHFDMWHQRSTIYSFIYSPDIL